MENLQRNLGVLLDEKPFLEASKTNSIVSLSSASGYVRAPRFLTMDSEPSDFKSLHVGHCILVNGLQRMPLATHCHALEREEAARLATLQSAPGFYFEPIAR